MRIRHAVLSAILTAGIIVSSCGGGGSTGDALADRLTDAFDFDNGETRNGPPPAATPDDPEAPPSYITYAPERIFFEQDFGLTLAASGPDPSRIVGAIVYVAGSAGQMETRAPGDGGAGRHILVRQPATDGVLTLRGRLRDGFEDLAGTSFSVEVAAVDDQNRVYSYSAWQVEVRIIGTGDVRITLTWDTPHDLDLYVTDPQGNTISYESRTSPTGGELDVDSHAGCNGNTLPGIENIFWPPSSAPAGEYLVEVANYSNCGATDGLYTVDMVVRGERSSRPGTPGAEGERQTITTFTIE